LPVKKKSREDARRRRTKDNGEIMAEDGKMRPITWEINRRQHRLSGRGYRHAHTALIPLQKTTADRGGDGARFCLLISGFNLIPINAFYAHHPVITQSNRKCVTMCSIYFKSKYINMFPRIYVGLCLYTRPSGHPWYLLLYQRIIP
jgi:hypothetical protein